MRLWQRLTRPVLLAVFITANLASALPLVYCLAPGGHHGVELAHGTPHYDNTQAVRSEVSERPSGTAVTVVRDCLDVSMLPSADALSRATDSWRAPHKGAPIFQPPVLVTVLLPPTSSREDRITRDRPLAPNMALVAHRTVVLLI
jgi:hypothetical protein